MNDYRMVKYCRLCKKRYLINKGEKIRNYCEDCQKKFVKEGKNQGEKK